MSKRFANLSERLSADLPQDQIPPEREEEDDKNADQQDGTKPKEKPMADEPSAAALAEASETGRKNGFKAANDRMAAVFASDHYKGREASANELLATDMSADQILAVLPKIEKVEASTLTEEQAREAAEEAGRKDMKTALDETKNSNVDAGADASKPDARAEADAVWGKAYGLTEKGVK